jgi:GT2 family glycosyltransferase
MSDTQIDFLHPPEQGLVSVVIPTYNRARILGSAIESALRQKARTEIIVVDDGSRDDTEKVVSRFGSRIRYLRQRNAGVAAARNTGMRQAKGEFIAFLDSDDIWLDWKLEAQLAALRPFPKVGLVWTDMSAIDAKGKVVYERYLRPGYDAYREVDFDALMPQVATLGDVYKSAPPAVRSAVVRMGDLSSAIIMGNLVHTSTVLVRRDWIHAVGGLHGTWQNGGEDYEYYTRLCTVGPVMLIDTPSILYRIGEADQLTAPDKMLPLAENNLRTVRARLEDRKGRISLPKSTVKKRLATSLAWVGSAHFEAGHRLPAARHLAASLRVRPRLDRRIALLLLCALPNIALVALRAIKQAHLDWL